MSRAVITIRTEADRDRAARWAKQTREGMRIEFKEVKRSDDQNSKLWAMLTEVSAQLPWHGIKLAPDDWKFIFLDALKRELRVVPNIDGTGFVNLGRSSSDLSKSEMSDLIEVIHAFGAGHGVTFKDDPESSLPQSPTSSPMQTEAKPATNPPLPQVAGSNSQSPALSPTGDDSEGAGATGQAAAGPSLPQGWGINYAAALRRAQSKPSLKKYAEQFWKDFGGWAAHKDGPDGSTAVAIFDVFNTNFGNRDAIEAALREIV